MNKTLFIFLSLSVIFISCCMFPYYGIWSDGEGYYGYFPDIFITRDFINGGLHKYPPGTFILELPFLSVSYWIHIIGNFDFENGNSPFFVKTVEFAAFFYFSLTLMLMYKISRKYFSANVSRAALFTIIAGTPILFYVFPFFSFSHIFGCFACTLYMYFVILYEEKYETLPRVKQCLFDILSGALLGLAVLVRNMHIIISLIYILYGVNNIKTFKMRLKKSFQKNL